MLLINQQYLGPLLGVAAILHQLVDLCLHLVSRAASGGVLTRVHPEVLVLSPAHCQPVASTDPEDSLKDAD